MRFFLEAQVQGHDPQMVVSKDSSMANKCRSMGLGERIVEIPPSDTDVVSLISRIPRYRRILESDRSHIIFTFSLRDALVWSWVLRPYSAKALCLFINHEIVNSYRKIWLKGLISRIDHIFISSEEMLENIWAHLKVPDRKCSMILPFSGNLIPTAQERKRDNTSITIGMYISPIIRNQEEVQKILVMLKNLRLELDGKIQVKVRLFMDQDLPKTYLSDNIERLIQLLGGLDHVTNEKFEHLKLDLSALDIWFSPFIQEELEDFSLLALVNNVPIATPRTAVHMGLLKRFPGVGVSFKSGDAREMRTKLKEMIQNHDLFTKQLSEQASLIHEELIQRRSLLNNWGFLQRLVNRRNRYALRRDR